MIRRGREGNVLSSLSLHSLVNFWSKISYNFRSTLCRMKEASESVVLTFNRFTVNCSAMPRYISTVSSSISFIKMASQLSFKESTCNKEIYYVPTKISQLSPREKVKHYSLTSWANAKSINANTILHCRRGGSVSFFQQISSRSIPHSTPPSLLSTQLVTFFSSAPDYSPHQKPKFNLICSLQK